MTDLTKTSTYKDFLMVAVHQDLKVSNHDDNPLPADGICTIMCSVPSNVANQADASLIDSLDQIFWSTIDTCNWASKNIIDHDLLHH